MSTLADIILSFCISLVAIGLISILIPAGSMEKPMKMLTGITMFALLITPFVKGDIGFDFLNQTKNQTQEIQKTSLKRALALSQSQMELAIKELLYKNGIQVDEIGVYMDISEDNSIIISQISISSNFKSQEEKQVVKNIIKQELGVEAEVEVTDKGGVNNGT
ncbi:MAG TPA: hypothetical protein GXX17_03155 [Clostridiales bacterium]|nr:hypothetical protein [Clostridiales bacterium]